MKINAPLLVFILIVTSILVGMHYFVGKTILKYFGYDLITLLMISSLIFPVSAIADKLKINKFTSALYFFGSSWLGVVFITFSVLLFGEIIGLMFTLPLLVKGYILFATSIVFIIFAYATAANIVVTEVNIPVKTNKKISIIHVSDIHLGTIHRKKFTDKIVKKINTFKPEYVMITGDVFDGSGEVTREMVEPLGKLKTKAYFTTGNHENYQGLDKVLPVIKPYVNILRNEVIETNDLRIIGLDNPKIERINKYKPLDELALKKSKKPTVIMLHTPTAIESFENSNADIMLSGHTHAGQIFPFGLIVKTTYKHLYGLYKIGKKYLYVSSGVGTAGPPMRLFTKSEIVKINLVPIKND